jgi:hypothetical protein
MIGLMGLFPFTVPPQQGQLSSFTSSLASTGPEDFL